MSDTDLSELSIAELNKRRAEASDDDFGGVDRREVIDEELSRREEDRAELRDLLAMKNQLAIARDRGLGDDPTVEALEEHVDELNAAHHPDPQSELAEAADIDEEQVAALSDAEAEQAREHLAAIEMVAGSSNAGMRASHEEHVDALSELLDDHDVEVDALAESAVVEEPGASVDALFDDTDGA